MGSASLHLLQKINRRLGIIEDVVVFKKFRGKMVGVKLIKQLIESQKILNAINLFSIQMKTLFNIMNILVS